MPVKICMGEGDEVAHKKGYGGINEPAQPFANLPSLFTLRASRIRLCPRFPSPMHREQRDSRAETIRPDRDQFLFTSAKNSSRVSLWPTRGIAKQRPSRLPDRFSAECIEKRLRVRISTR